MWRRQRILERVLEEDEAIEPAKAEALRELEEVTDYLRKSPWRSRGQMQRAALLCAFEVGCPPTARQAMKIEPSGRSVALLN